MKRTTLLLAGLLVLTTAAWAQSQKALINHQGKLMRGTNAVSETVSIVFKVFDAATNGTCIYEEANQVIVVNGFYSTLLGNNPSMGDLEETAKADEAWLELVIGGNAMKPREKFTPPPFSKKATETLRLSSKLSDYIVLGGLSSVGYVQRFSASSGQATNQNAFIMFPPATRRLTVSAARVMRSALATAGGNTNEYLTATLEIYNLQPYYDTTSTPAKIASLPLSISAMTNHAWMELVLSPAASNRVIDVNQLPVFRWNTGIGTKHPQIDEVLFEIDVK